jgi:hypothetical protein
VKVEAPRVILRERRAEGTPLEDRARDRRNSKLQNLATCAFPRTGQRDPRILSSFVGAHVPDEQARS